MLYVASPDYSQLRTNYLKAKDAYALAQKANARAQDLYQHQAIAEQNLEQAESAEVQAERRSGCGASCSEGHGHHRSGRCWSKARRRLKCR